MGILANIDKFGNGNKLYEGWPPFVMDNNYIGPITKVLQYLLLD